MSRSQAASLLRQCSASLSARSIGRQAGVPARYSQQTTRRHFATQEGSQQPDSSSSAAEGSGNGSAAAEGGNKAESAQPNAENELTTKLKAKEAEVVDLTSRLRYLQADFLNLQRNAAREKEQTRDFAISKFAGELLETVDVLSLALKSVPEAALKAPTSTLSSSSPSSSSSSGGSGSKPQFFTPSTPATKSAHEYLKELHLGVEMTHRLLLQTLFKYNVKPFDPTGDVFDPNRHEALYQAPVPGKTPGTVIECSKTGFTIKDRTLRAAQVGVAMEPPTLTLPPKP